MISHCTFRIEWNGYGRAFWWLFKCDTFRKHAIAMCTATWNPISRRTPETVNRILQFLFNGIARYTNAKWTYVWYYASHKPNTSNHTILEFHLKIRRNKHYSNNELLISSWTKCWSHSLSPLHSSTISLCGQSPQNTPFTFAIETYSCVCQNRKSKCIIMKLSHAYPPFIYFANH